jgi:hypothetical protein
MSPKDFFTPVSFDYYYIEEDRNSSSTEMKKSINVIFEKWKTNSFILS